MNTSEEAKRFVTDEWAQLEIYGSGLNGRGRMKNISSGGAYFELDDQAPVPAKGDLVRITVELKEVGKKHRVNGEVIWIHDDQEKGGAGFGVSFLKPDQVFSRLASRY